MSWSRGVGLPGRLLLAGLLVGCGGEASESAVAAPERPPREGEFRSSFLEADLVVPPGVFPPAEAEALFLPLLRDHAEILEGARVLDIGAGTGVIGLYALRMGAASLVATDIDPGAVAAVEENARRLGVEDRVEARLVSTDDLGAFSVVREGEVFDLVLSNPPYSLDLDAEGNNPVVDTGDLGLSILRGLRSHLAPGGRALLLYNSLFYQQTMVKLARHLGYDVRHHLASIITPWELGALFDLYFDRVLEREGIPAGELGFGPDDQIPVAETVRRRPEAPLLGRETGRLYPGFIVIQVASP